jgi:hypothetical protein
MGAYQQAILILVVGAVLVGLLGLNTYLKRRRGKPPQG